MQELKLTDEELELRNSYERKRYAKQLASVTPEERQAKSKYRNQRRQINSMQSLICRWRSSAKKRSIEWLLTDEYLIALMLNTTKCPALGINLSYEFYTGKGAGRKDPSRASLDRIDNSKGYTEGNVQIVSWAYNNIKSNHTEQELMLYCESIAKRLRSKNNGFFS